MRRLHIADSCRDHKNRVDFYSIDVCYFSPHNDLTRAIVWLFCAPETGYRPVLRLPHFYFLQIAGEIFQ